MKHVPNFFQQIVSYTETAVSMCFLCGYVLYRSQKKKKGTVCVYSLIYYVKYGLKKCQRFRDGGLA